jgi:serine/threonine-protein kinase
MDAEAHVGSIISGKYRVERVLGRGGMGVVVAARHLHLGERVAIKFPIARMILRSDVAARLAREGRAAMRIRSEHVARVFYVGALETGEPYLVMEHLNGQDLGVVLARGGPLPIDAAVEYILQAAEALAEAHALGLVHRDIKPGNLFLVRRADGSPLVKVIDFGISKRVSVAADGADLQLTESNAMVGSPLYMAPEQMRASRTIDARADLWALGATLYTLLTGAPPFPARSILEIHELILRGAPPLRDALPGAPPALEAIVQRCLRPDPEDRYADVAEFAAALADVAPEHARTSAQRIALILATPAAPEDAPLEEAAAEPSSSIFDGTADPSDTGRGTAPSAEPSWADATRQERNSAALPVAAGQQVANSPVAGAPSVPPRRSAASRALVIAAVAAAAVIGATVEAKLAAGHTSAPTASAAPDADPSANPGAAASAMISIRSALPIAHVRTECAGIATADCRYTEEFPTVAAFDGDHRTYWAAPYDVTSSILTVTLRAPSTISAAVLFERGPLPKRAISDTVVQLLWEDLEFRVRGWELWLSNGTNEWQVASGKDIGSRREIRLDQRYHDIQSVWLKIESTDGPSLYEVEFVP